MASSSSSSGGKSFNLKAVVDDLSSSKNLPEDDSLVALPGGVMEKQGLVSGDTVSVRGKKGKETLCILMQDDSCDTERVRMSTGEPLLLCVLFCLHTHCAPCLC